MLRELLTDAPESVRWPDSLRGALGTRGFAHEVQSVLGRAREKGLDGDALRELGATHDLPEYVAAGLFLEQYLVNLDQQSATDYTDLIRRAVLEAGAHRDELRAQFAHVFVDEYQDTDPAQVELLHHLAGDGRDLTVVGDPHQSIYAFRGAEVRGLLEFPREFARPDGTPADVLALRTTRRFGPRLLTATQRVAGRLSLPGAIDPSAREAFLSPVAEPGPFGEGRVEVTTYETERAEAEHLADLLRRAHLEDGIGWDEMAVLVRSGQVDHPRAAASARGCRRAGRGGRRRRTPRARPGRAADARRAARRAQPRQRRPRPRGVRRPGPGRGAADRSARGARRGRRTPPRPRAARPGEGTHPRDGHAAAAVERAAARCRHRPGFLDGLGGPAADRARALHDLLVRARAELDDGASAEQLLWTLWSGTGWPHRLRRSVSRRRCRRASRQPRPRLDGRALRRRRPRGGAARPRRGPQLPGHPRRPADPVRHPVRARRPRRRRTPADGAPLQGPGVAAGRDRPRPGRGVARPAPSLDAAPGRPDRPRRTGPAGHAARAAPGGAPAVLRRLHPRAAAARGDRGAVARGRRRAAVAVPRRARRRRDPREGSPGPAAVPGGTGERAAPHGRRPGHLRAAPRQQPHGGSRGWPPRRSDSASWCRRPTRRRGGAPVRRASRSARCGIPNDRCRSRPACSSR